VLFWPLWATPSPPPVCCVTMGVWSVYRQIPSAKRNQNRLAIVLTGSAIVPGNFSLLCHIALAQTTLQTSLQSRSPCMFSPFLHPSLQHQYVFLPSNHLQFYLSLFSTSFSILHFFSISPRSIVASCLLFHSLHTDHVFFYPPLLCSRILGNVVPIYL